jgi:hypothetical protein
MLEEGTIVRPGAKWTHPDLVVEDIVPSLWIPDSRDFDTPAG